MLEAQVIVNIEGFDTQLDDIMKEVDGDLQVIAAAVRDEAKASSEFKNKSGDLRKSIKMRKSSFEDGGFIVYTKDPKAHLVEFGHVMFIHGKPTGERVPAHSFLRSAVEKVI